MCKGDHMENNNVIDSSILNEYDTLSQRNTNLKNAENIKEAINNVFNDFGIDASIKDYIVGPNVTRFALITGKNVSIKAISNLINDIQVRLGGLAVRLDMTSKDMFNIGLEVENIMQETVSFKELYEALPPVDKHPLAIPLGVNVNKKPTYLDLEDAPHILISGTVGSGKSILINSMITTLIMRHTPKEVRLALFDPKTVEFNRYNNMPHLYSSIARDIKAAEKLLKDLQIEMEDRYEKFAELGSSNLMEFNEEAEDNGYQKLPYIIVIVDEYGDLIDANKDLAFYFICLAQKARAAGINLILGVQNPTTNVVTGVLKANLPVHIGLMMSSFVDSMTILGEGGAEKLMGRGDMLIQSHLLSKLGLVRLQGAFIHRTEIKRVLDALKEKYKDIPPLNPINDKKVTNDLTNKTKQENEEDEHYKEIKKWVMTQDFMSISRIQRECAVGFNRAGRYFLRLQLEGIVSKESTKHGYPVIKKSEL